MWAGGLSASPGGEVNLICPLLSPGNQNWPIKRVRRDPLIYTKGLNKMILVLFHGKKNQEFEGMDVEACMWLYVHVHTCMHEMAGSFMM